MHANCCQTDSHGTWLSKKVLTKSSGEIKYQPLDNMIGRVVTLTLILIMSLKHDSSFEQRNTLAKDKYQLSYKDNNETV